MRHCRRARRAGTRVETYRGIAYTTGGTALRAIDLLTGANLGGLTLPGGGETTGLSRERGTLFAYVSGSDTFVAVDVRSERPRTLGSTFVDVASGDVGVVAGGGIAWLAGSGLRSVDIARPATPRLLGGAQNFFTARRIALNGSGLGVLSPDGNAFVQIYDTSDPLDTDALLLEFALTQGARDIAIDRGVAFVAAGSRLEVVNYLAFDSGGVPPVVTVSSPVADSEPATPGLQLLAGTSVPLEVVVSDDVQVRSVELLVDGAVVLTDTSYPFELVAVAVSDDIDAPVTVVEVRATDSGGNAGVSNRLVIDVVPERTPPEVVLVDPAGGTRPREGLRALRIEFSEPMEGTVADARHFALSGAGPNRLFGDGDDVAVAIASVQLRNDDSLVQLDVDGLASGIYRLRADRAALRDRAGNALGEGVADLTRFQAIPEHPYELTVSSTKAATGGSVTLAVRIDTVDPLQGWTFGLCHDPAALAVSGFALGSDITTLVTGGPPEFRLIEEATAGGAGVVMVAIVSFSRPIFLPPGSGHEVLAVTYDALLGAGESTEVCICDGLRGSGQPLRGEFTVYDDPARTEVPRFGCGRVAVAK